MAVTSADKTRIFPKALAKDIFKASNGVFQSFVTSVSITYHNNESFDEPCMFL